MSSQVKIESFLMNLFLPLCFRVGIGKKGKRFRDDSYKRNRYRLLTLFNNKLIKKNIKKTREYNNIQS